MQLYAAPRQTIGVAAARTGPPARCRQLRGDCSSARRRQLRCAVAIAAVTRFADQRGGRRPQVPALGLDASVFGSALIGDDLD
ncbi:MAG: hypothetical protein E6J90_22445 [Deltaproteobacteria bacterium]|nr:MAG: hypothetical protein E6J90_22445 [Deltaproteobacteria bacterium]